MTTRGVLRATARNTSDEPAPLDIVLKGWFHDPSLRAEPNGDVLLLHGPDSVVAMVGSDLSGAQVSDEKGALDRNLRDGGLAGAGPGHIGALRRPPGLQPQEPERRDLAWAEAADAESASARARELWAMPAPSLESARRGGRPVPRRGHRPRGGLPPGADEPALEPEPLHLGRRPATTTRPGTGRSPPTTS